MTSWGSLATGDFGDDLKGYGVDEGEGLIVLGEGEQEVGLGGEGAGECEGEGKCERTAAERHRPRIRRGGGLVDLGHSHGDC